MFTHSKKVVVALLCISVLSVSACAGRGGIHHGHGGGGGNVITGLVIGGIIGGVIGHEIGKDDAHANATIIGPTVEIRIGGNVGHHMNHTDRTYVSHSLEMVRTGVATQWYNPDTGYEYRVVPIKTDLLNGETCRDYIVEATKGGVSEVVHGKACRHGDGNWIVRK
ncbi:MAG: RT0821/Lpp0805 family surface protein [Aliiglaciecola sp.]|uniref:RT0821/Lpp0805 family surface protein n=1 Tax=Aliiglaciecola sp. TaxID=1872441 RepID=UPI00329A0B1C